jgi:hypothetical protein
MERDILKKLQLSLSKSCWELWLRFISPSGLAFSTVSEALSVSRSGLYAWLILPKIKRAQLGEVIGSQVYQSFIVNHRTYDVRQIFGDVLELR